MIQATLLEIGIAVVVLIGACGITWFAADAHYSQALSSLEGQLKGANTVQKDELKAGATKDTAVTKGIDDEAQQQIGSMATEIADLSKRNLLISLQHTKREVNGTEVSGRITTSVPADCPAVVDAKSDGRGTTTGNRPIPETTGPVEESATISAAVLDRSLAIGQDSIKAELLFRQFERGVGQSGKPKP
jgi:hypothetical protein